MKIFRYIPAILAAVLIPACQDLHMEEPLKPETPQNPSAVSNVIDGSLTIENSRIYGESPKASMPPLATRALIDQVTTRRMDSNFLRIDEDIDHEKADSPGKYTFTGNDRTYAETNGTEGVNWMKAYLAEAIVVSSPDNTAPDPSLPEGLQGGHFRSVSLDPVQTYNILVQPRDENGNEVPDTTQFYHTRMVGWFPRNCNVPRDPEGKAANTQFENSRFDAQRETDKITANSVEREVVSLKFTGLDGTVDLMVSNMCEGQHWHNPADWYGHTGQTPPSDIHPVNGSSIYRKPFGHNHSSPSYSNFFTYRHYLSAIRVYVRAEKSEQNLKMWGDIEGVTILDQPTSVKVWLPEQINEFGEAYDWGDRDNFSLNPGPLFGDDSNHPDESKESAQYPIDLENSHSLDKLYLGNALVEPDAPVSIELHTTSGIYNFSVNENFIDKNGESVKLFQAGYVYNIIIDLKTDGTIASIIEDDSQNRYYDLTNLTELDTEAGTSDKLYAYRYANCYVIETSDERRVKAFDDPSDDSKDVEYHGYAFAAHIIGNGESGILKSGAQSMYPTSADISPAYASLLWTDNKDLISNVELIYDYVRFCLHDPKDKKGNAVIAVFDENDKILWSWHIWITPELNEQSFDTGVENVNMSTTITMLDRNLGATKARWTDAGDVLETYGLYYQWGRKDPSPGPPSWDYSIRSLSTAPYYDYALQEYTAAEVFSKATPTLQDGVENPMYLIMPTQQTQSYYFNWTHERYDFLWGFTGTSEPVHKTIYDPCPFGYRVATSALQTLAYGSYLNGGSAERTDYGQILSYPNNTGTTSEGGYDDVTDNRFYFPYTGYKGVDRTMNSYMLAWKYVGEKADYQDATIDLAPGTAAIPNPDYLARGRVYFSKERTWTETSVGSYTGWYVSDFANRRTAAPVRCVKDVDMAVIVSSISTSTPYIARPADGTSDENYPSILLECSAVSYSSNIRHVRLVAVWHDYDAEGNIIKRNEEILKDLTDNYGGTWHNTQKAFQISPEWISGSPYVTFEFYATNDMGVTSENAVTINVIDYELNTDWWRDRPTYPDVEALDNTYQLKGEKTRRAVIYNGTVDPQVISNVQFRKVSKNGAAVTDEWHNGGDPYEIPAAEGDRYENSAYLYYEFVEDEAGTYEYEIRFDIMGSTQRAVKLPAFEVAEWNVDIVWDAAASGDKNLWSASTFRDAAGTGQITIDGNPVPYQISGAVVTRKVKLTNFEYILNREDVNLVLTAAMGSTPLTITRDEIPTLESDDAIYYNVTFSKNAIGTFNDITLTVTYLGNVGDIQTPPYTVTGISFDPSEWDTAYSDAACTVPTMHLSGSTVYRKLRVFGNVDPSLVEGLTASYGTNNYTATVLEDNSTSGSFDRTYSVGLRNLPAGTQDVTATVSWAPAVGGGGQSTALRTAVADINIDTAPWSTVYRTMNGTQTYPIQLAGAEVYRRIRIHHNDITTEAANVTSVKIGGTEATCISSNGDNESLDQVWSVAVKKDAKGRYNDNVEVTWTGGRKTGTVTTEVYGPGSRISSSTISSGYYVIENTNYTGSYLEVDDSGNLKGSGNGNVDYVSVFHINSGSIESMYGTYATGYNRNITFGASGTTYSISRSGYTNNRYYRISYSSGRNTYYWDITSITGNVEGATQNNSSNRNWYLYQVTID